MQESHSEYPGSTLVIEEEQQPVIKEVYKYEFRSCCIMKLL